MAIVSQDWLHRFTVLRVDPDKGRGRAPHKPLLLLAVLDLLEAGQITDGWVTLSPDLVVRFQTDIPLSDNRSPLLSGEVIYRGETVFLICF